MIGKKLYYLIKELSVSEKRLLYNNNGNSSDKRDDLLIQLLKSNPKTKDAFLDKLKKTSELLNSEDKNEQEKNKNLRRFIDFASKRIENMKLTLLCNSNPKIRNYLLAQIYEKSGHHDLNERYYNQANKESGDDYWVQISYKNDQLTNVYKSQMVQDADYWRKLIKEKEALLSNYYQGEMARVVSDISRS